MIRIYLKSAYRQLLKNKLFSLVNIIGLSTGLASVMALSILVYQYYSTDKDIRGIEKMYYLKTITAEGSVYMNTPYLLLGEVVNTCPEVEAATHIQSWYYPWLKVGEKEFQERTDFVDSGYFRVFQFPFKYGDPVTALKSKFSIVLSDELSQKFFGNENPLGKTITADDTLQLTVSGVLHHVPTNSTVRPEIILTTQLLMGNAYFKSDADWYNGFATNYLRLRPNASPATLDTKLAQIVKNNFAPERKKDRVISVPFTKISQENDSMVPILIKGAIAAGIFILLIVFVNLINLNAATLYNRSKEVAVRQMIGGSKISIAIQLCVENGLIVFVSVALGWLLFSLILLPFINNLIKDKFGEVMVGFQSDYPLVLFFGAVALLITILAASLPGWKLLSVKVTDTVKGKLSSANLKTGTLRNIFITVQFILAILLISVTMILNWQIKFMKSASPGYNKNDVAAIGLDLAYRNPDAAITRFESILNDLKRDSRVISVSTNSVIPTDYFSNFNMYYDPVTNKEVNFRHASADVGYFPTYQIPFIQGENFDEKLEASEKKSIIINRAGLNALGWKNAVGKQLKAKGSNETFTVIGVTEDFHYRNLQGSIEPLLHWNGGKASLDNTYLSVRTTPGSMKDVMQKLETAFKELPSRRNFSYTLVSDKVEKQYQLYDSLLKITNYVALLTILIASMGMFGLIALFAKQRVKEIGIRKVLGASIFGITKLLLKDFAVLVVIAIVVASPIAWYVMSKWLQDFAYRIHIHWWMFALSGLIALFIAFLTVGYQAIKSAVANPVGALRND